MSHIGVGLKLEVLQDLQCIQQQLKTVQLEIVVWGVDFEGVSLKSE